MTIFEYITYIITTKAARVAADCNHESIGSTDLLFALYLASRRSCHTEKEFAPDPVMAVKNTNTFRLINNAIRDLAGTDIATTYDSACLNAMLNSIDSPTEKTPCRSYSEDGVLAMALLMSDISENAANLSIAVPILALVSDRDLECTQLLYGLEPAGEEHPHPIPSIDDIVRLSGIDPIAYLDPLDIGKKGTSSDLAVVAKDLKHLGKFIEEESAKRPSHDELDEVMATPKNDGHTFSENHWSLIRSDLRRLEDVFSVDGLEHSKNAVPFPVHFIEDLNDVYARSKGGYSSNASALHSMVVSLNSGRSLLLMGKTGVGKKSLVKQLVYEINQDHCLSPRLKDSHIYRVDAEALVGGTIWRGQLEGRFAKLLQFVKDPEHDGMILYFENLDLIINLGASSDNPGGGLSSALTPALADGSITVIGCIDEKNYSRFEERCPHFINLFGLLALQESEGERLKTILQENLDAKSQERGLSYAPGFLDDLIAMGKLLENGEANPLKDIRLLERTFDYTQLSGESIVDGAMLEAAVEEQYTLSLSKNAAEKTYRALKAALKGQDEAIEEVYEGLVGIEQGLSSPKKPALSLAFFGPSGVGKTETAKIIAREFCGSEKALVKIDAGQFNTPQDLDKLFDGHGGGILVSALQQNPRCCILIDEIEKAPAALAYNLMALLDEGIVRDSAGQPQSAKGAIVILTSNVGSDLEVGAVHQTGFTRESVTDDDVAKAIRGRFKNEFLGRIDKIVVFHHLQTSALEAIVEADVETLKAHSSAEVKELPWHKEDTAKVLAESDVKRQGARALEKNVSAQLLDRLFEERSAKKSA